MFFESIGVTHTQYHIRHIYVYMCMCVYLNPLLRKLKTYTMHWKGIRNLVKGYKFESDL